MLKRGFYTFFLATMLSTFPVLAQVTDTPTKVITIAKTCIKDCISIGENLWVLQTDGLLLRVNCNSYEVKDSLSFPGKIVAIGNYYRNLYTATADGTVRMTGPDGNSNTLWTTSEVIQNFAFTSSGKCFLITGSHIYDPEKNLNFNYHEAYQNPLAHQGDLSSLHVDKQDNIWLGFDGGEWGGDLTIFSTATSKFINTKKKKWDFLFLNPVKSIFEVNGAVHVSTSIHHSTLRSAVIEMSDPYRFVFRSGNFPPAQNQDIENTYQQQALHIGPANYNPQDSSFYFSCQFGVFKGYYKKDLAKIENWSFVFKTETSDRCKMDFERMFFSHNKLFLMSRGNGIHIWDGKNLVLLNATKMVDN